MRAAYGNITAASVGAIQRGILVLEEQGADRLFGEPALSLVGSDADRFLRQRRREPARCDAARADRAARLRGAAAVAAVGTVRRPAGGRRRRSSEARVVLRRSAPVVQRRAEAAARQDRTGGAADPFERRRRVLRVAESARHSGDRAGSARTQGGARVARVHAEGSTGHQGRWRRDFARNRASTWNASSPNSKPAKR